MKTASPHTALSSEHTSSTFAYQFLRTNGFSIPLIDSYLQRLASDASTFLEECIIPTAKEVVAECSLLFKELNLTERANHILLLQLFEEGRFSLRYIETSIYEGFPLRLIRPYGKPCEVGSPLDGNLTSATLAKNTLLRMTLGNDGGVFINFEPHSGTIYSIDGGTAVAVKGRNVTISATMVTSEAEMVLRNMVNVGRAVRLDIIKFDDLQNFDEVWAIDHRGITTLCNIGDTFYGDIVASVTAKQINW